MKLKYSLSLGSQEDITHIVFIGIFADIASSVRIRRVAQSLSVIFTH